MMRFAGRSPFGWAALDIKTLGFALTGLPYRRTVKPALPAEWKDPLPHTHVALDDALEQGALSAICWPRCTRQAAAAADGAGAAGATPLAADSGPA